MNLRHSNLEKLARDPFDVLIVGGGINGAVSASALTTMGARVALIDRGDFAGLTSQASSNLVWGGIKYMESGELGLVRKLCASRNQLIRTYPSTVKEVRFFTTLDKGFRWNRFTLYLGALLYWALGAFSTRPPRLLSKAQILAEEPAIDVGRTSGGFEYSDAYLVDNDARFVFNFVRAAIDHGGIVANYVESLGAIRSEDGHWRTRARDQISGREFEIRSRVLVNACGPHVDELNAMMGQETSHKHVFSKGVHLVVDRITPLTRVLTFFADDGRLFFILPLGPKSCLGTTDTRVDSLPPEVTAADRRFILDNVNRRLALERPIVENDIIAERCGVRPLVVEGRGRDRDEGDWTSLSRKHAIEVDRSTGHLSIFGGKLTDCLNVGEEVADLMGDLGVPLPYRDKRWYGEPPDEVRDEYFHQATLMRLDEMTAPESSELLSTRLWRRYGSSALRLLEEIRIDPAMGEVLIKGTEYIRAEIYHAGRREMVVRLEDFLRRRSKISQIERTEVILAAPGLLEACRILFGEHAEQRLDEYRADHGD